MAYVTLAEAKKHCNIDEDFTSDDAYLETLVEVATDAVENHLNVGTLANKYGDGAIPSPIKSAILLLTATLYSNREATTEKALQMPIYNYLLLPYRNIDIK